jgi:hypothetical protein
MVEPTASTLRVPAVGTPSTFGRDTMRISICILNLSCTGLMSCHVDPDFSNYRWDNVSFGDQVRTCDGEIE